MEEIRGNRHSCVAFKSKPQLTIFEVRHSFCVLSSTSDMDENMFMVSSFHYHTNIQDEKLQITGRTKHEYISSKDIAPFCCHPVTDVLGSPISAMEYLSRSWSPETSNFLQIFSTNVRNKIIYNFLDGGSYAYMFVLEPKITK